MIGIGVHDHRILFMLTGLCRAARASGFTSYDQFAAPVPERFSAGLGPEPLRRTICCNASNQNGAPKSVASAVMRQPRNVRKPTPRVSCSLNFVSVHTI